MPKTTRELMIETEALHSDSNRIAFEWLLTDVQTCLMFAHVALDPANSAEKRSRNRVHARRGYDAVNHFFHKIEFPPEQRHQLMAHLRLLKSTLRKAGEQFS